MANEDSIFMKKKYLIVLALISVLVTLCVYMADIFSFFENRFDNVESPDVAAVTPSPSGNNVDSGSNTSNTPSAILEPVASPTPALQEPVEYNAEVIPECLPENYNIVYDVISDRDVLSTSETIPTINFPAPENYSLLEGITCFRGNNYRNSASYGFAEIVSEKFEEVWSVKVGYIGDWTGVGWTGQPAIVKWEDSIKKIMNISQEKKAKTDLIEVIYATLDGKIYFIDLEDGKPTRPPIDTGAPYKGSVMVDPRGYPLLFAGEGVPHDNGEIGYRIFSLIDQKEIFYLDGLDSDKYRSWGAFDSNGLLDPGSDTLIECGENGILYKIKLNTDFNINESTVSLNPEIVKYRYKPLKSNKIGVECSPVYYKNYIYFVDNAGFLQCVNLDTLEPEWIRDVTDDTDSTMVLEDDGTGVFLYTACEVDIQGSQGYSYIRKINALTGKLIWEKSYKCIHDPSINGGALATPVLGKGDISDIVVFNIAKTENNRVGKIVALYKDSGEEAWRIDHPYYCWSSPVDVYTKEGKSYLIVCDSGAYMNLLEGKTGKILDKIALHGNVEASPAVYGNMIVVGTRGQLIWGIRLN